MSVSGYLTRQPVRIVGLIAVIAAAGVVVVWQDLGLARLLTLGYLDRSLRAATPIALVAIGGLFAEKSGVFNISVEGFMIFGAVNGLAAASLVSGNGPVTQFDLWIGLFVAVLISALLTTLFAVLMIRYEADQIVAGLAVWFIGLGFGPFTAILIWGSRNSGTVGRIGSLDLPVLSGIPVLGPVLFGASPFILLTIAITIGAWVFLYRTRYGYWLQAAGENPEALDTAGIDVNRVRYAAVIFSGTMAGLAGAVLTLGVTGNFIGSGMTVVDGRGWIGIVAYLFGNYNPIGAFLAALLFGAMDMLQIQFQTIGVPLPSSLVDLFPYVVVIVVLTFYGSTRMPSRVGEPYESEE